MMEEEDKQRLSLVEKENREMKEQMSTMLDQLIINTKLLEENKETMTKMIKVFKAATGALQVIQFFGGVGLKLAAFIAICWHTVLSIKEYIIR